MNASKTLDNAVKQARVKNALEGVTIGCCTTLWGVLVWRTSETQFILGETININSRSVDICTAIDFLISRKA